MIKADLERITENMEYQDGVYVARRGSANSKQRLWLMVSTHGNEIAGPMALHRLLRQKWEWDNVEMVACMQDPEGYLDEGYGFISANGDASCWPPLWGYRKNEEAYWLAFDENSSWGNNVVVPERHLKMRELIDKLNPTFCLSLHETVETETKRAMFWAGAGLLTIECYPLSAGELNIALDPVGDPLNDPVGWVFRVLWDWFRPVLRMPRWKTAALALRSNPYFSLLAEIADRYTTLGGKMTGRKWMDYQEYFGAPVVGEGRMVHGPEMILSEWYTCTDYALAHYGCPGVTTETFPVAEMGLRGVEDRVFYQLAYTGAVLDVLNKEEDLLNKLKDF